MNKFLIKHLELLADKWHKSTSCLPAPPFPGLSFEHLNRPFFMAAHSGSQLEGLSHHIWKMCGYGIDSDSWERERERVWKYVRGSSWLWVGSGCWINPVAGPCFCLKWNLKPGSYQAFSLFVTETNLSGASVCEKTSPESPPGAAARLIYQQVVRCTTHGTSPSQIQQFIWTSPIVLCFVSFLLLLHCLLSPHTFTAPPLVLVALRLCKACIIFRLQCI